MSGLSNSCKVLKKLESSLQLFLKSDEKRECHIQVSLRWKYIILMHKSKYLEMRE